MSQIPSTTDMDGFRVDPEREDRVKVCVASYNAGLEAAIAVVLRETEFVRDAIVQQIKERKI